MSETISQTAVAVLAMLLVAGCASSSGGAAAPTTTDAAQAIPPGSPFAKIRIDMGHKQVIDLIGPPTDVDGHMTGKGFIPFYFGNDAHRVVHLYKGQGRIIYTQDMRVVQIEYDPAETGYR